MKVIHILNLLMSIKKILKSWINFHFTNIEADTTSTTTTNELYCKGELQGTESHTKLYITVDKKICISC